MITNNDSATLIHHHFAELQAKYPEFTLGQNLFGEWVVRGPICASAIYETTELLIDGVTIEIKLPIVYPDTHPVARETTGLTDGFHTNDDGILCLGSPLAVKATFESCPTILGFMERLLIPFFFAFKYWKNHGEVPFGELSHGGKGILEYYMDIFDISVEENILGFLQILADDSYRGHLPCPCNSKLIIRRCHGEMLRNLAKLQSQDDYFQDYCCIIKYFHDNKLPISRKFLCKRALIKKRF